MAKPPIVEPSTAEKIKRAIADLRERQAEVKEYDAKAAELATTD